MIDRCRKIEDIIVEFMVFKIGFEFLFVFVDNIVEFIDFDRFEIIINKLNIDDTIRITNLLSVIMV